jgi:hypothetical protein
MHACMYVCTYVRMHACMYVSMYASSRKVSVVFCPILTELQYSRHITAVTSSTKFHQNPSDWSPAVPSGQTDGQTDRQTDMAELTVAIWCFAKALNNRKGRLCYRLMSIRTRTVMCCCERGKELSGAMQRGILLDRWEVDSLTGEVQLDGVSLLVSCLVGSLVNKSVNHSVSWLVS